MYSNYCEIILKFSKYKKSDLLENLSQSGLKSPRANFDTGQKFHITLAVRDQTGTE